ncbi:MAG: acyltransferase 3 [Bacteroidetes bacterium]|nr:acyltransferase 3 [Bacteroidota bacterium]
MTGEKTIQQKKVFFPNLDGLRFLCFLSVFLFHSFYTEFDSIKNSGAYIFVKKDLFANGNIGVNFFFVLSGFLITYLLIEEKNFHKKIDIKKFWLRRILRIWPLYYVCVLFGFVAFPMLKAHFGQTPNETAHVISYLTFTNNFDFIKYGLPDASILGVLWSIAIEEQFYFVWPILLTIVPTKHYLKLFTGIIICSLIFRCIYTDPLMYEHHTLSCMGDLTIGALGAYVCRMPQFRSRIENMSKVSIALIYAAFITVFFFREQLLERNFYVHIFERSFIAMIILMIILEQNFAKNSFFKMGGFKQLSKLGLISYGLYCLHFIGILITVTLSKMYHFNTKLWIVLLVETPVALFLTIIISSINYRYFETPFLKLKEKFAYITR